MTGVYSATKAWGLAVFSSYLRSRLLFLLAVCPLLAMSGMARAADRYLVDSVSLQTSSSLPKSLMDGVDPRGWLLYTQSYGIRDSICEIFLAKTVASRHEAAGGTLHYSVLQPGAFIGIVHLLPEATEDYSADFHNQQLKPGYYTMRYAVMPGGTYEYGTKLDDFVVLSPANMDRDPARILKPEELSHLGSATSGSDVAASMELVAADGREQKSPSVKVDAEGICIFQVKLQTAPAKGRPSKELPLAVAMFTPLHGPEGS